MLATIHNITTNILGNNGVSFILPRQTARPKGSVGASHPVGLFDEDPLVDGSEVRRVVAEAAIALHHHQRRPVQLPRRRGEGGSTRPTAQSISGRQ